MKTAQTETLSIFVERRDRETLPKIILHDADWTYALSKEDLA